MYQPIRYLLEPENCPQTRKRRNINPNRLILQFQFQPLVFWSGSGRCIHTHRIHAWYIYLHLAKIMVNVGKYTIHGSYGIDLDPVFQYPMVIFKVTLQ